MTIYSGVLRQGYHTRMFAVHAAWIYYVNYIHINTYVRANMFGQLCYVQLDTHTHTHTQANGAVAGFP
jgi:hypothetical protein